MSGPALVAGSASHLRGHPLVHNRHRDQRPVPATRSGSGPLEQGSHLPTDGIGLPFSVLCRKDARSVNPLERQGAWN